jgi:lipoprotein-anchoring transpeptidase ErfK/SrfK
MDDLFTRIKAYIYDNRYFITASILSSVVIIGLIFVISIFKGADKSKISSDDYESLYNTNSLGELSSDKTLTNEDDSTQTTDMSDLNFSLPEDATEETETTLPDSEYPYLIKVNRVQNCVTIYTQDSSGEYTVPYKAMVCSTGKLISYTPTGTFNISSKYTWRLMVDGTYSQYATRFNNGILFHSVPCYSPKNDQLEYEEFNKLGSPASLGCVRLCVADAKWIYDNCPSGTTVIVYDDASSPGPLGKPSMIKIPDDSPYKGWDPTDPNTNNPWNSFGPVINASDITISLGQSGNILSAITATDTCGNDISSSIKISGNYDVNKVGTYNINLSVTDLLGRTANKSIVLKVISGSSSTTTSNTKQPTTSNTVNSSGNIKK